MSSVNATSNLKLRSSKTPDALALEYVVGITSQSNALFSSERLSGRFAYAAGSIVVVYDPHTNTHVRYLTEETARAVTALAFAPNGRYVATGEGGARAVVRVFDALVGETHQELKRHQHGVQAVSFSPNNKYLVSVGDRTDGSVIVWDWSSATALTIGRITASIHDVAFLKENEFVTAGDSHFKYWTITPSGHAAATLDAKGVRGASATSVAALPEGRVVAANADSGRISRYGINRSMEVFIDLQTNHVHAVDASENLVAVASDEGIVRVFSASSLEYMFTLPRPAALGNRGGSQGESATPVYADAKCIRISPEETKITVVYADASLFVWDITEQPAYHCSTTSHAGAISGLFMRPARRISGITDVAPREYHVVYSTAKDGTMREWNIPVDAQMPLPRTQQLCQKLLYVSPDHLNECLWDKQCATGNTAGVTAMAVDEANQLVVCGFSTGNVGLYLLDDFAELSALEAHEGSVTAVDIAALCGNSGSEPIYLATGSEDGLVHLFRIEEELELVKTLSGDGSAITSVSIDPEEKSLTWTSQRGRVSTASLAGNAKPSAVTLPSGSTVSATRTASAGFAIAHRRGVGFVSQLGTAKKAQIDVVIGETLGAPTSVATAVTYAATDSSGAAPRLGVAAADARGSVAVLDASSASNATLCVAPCGAGGRVTSLSVASNGRRVAAGTAEGVIAVFRVEGSASRALRAGARRVAPQTTTQVGGWRTTCASPATERRVYSGRARRQWGQISVQLFGQPSPAGGASGDRRMSISRAHREAETAALSPLPTARRLCLNDLLSPAEQLGGAQESVRGTTNDTETDAREDRSSMSQLRRMALSDATNRKDESTALGSKFLGKTSIVTETEDDFESSRLDFFSLSKALDSLENSAVLDDDKKGTPSKQRSKEYVDAVTNEAEDAIAELEESALELSRSVCDISTHSPLSTGQRPSAAAETGEHEGDADDTVNALMGSRGTMMAHVRRTLMHAKAARALRQAISLATSTYTSAKRHADMSHRAHVTAQGDLDCSTEASQDAQKQVDELAAEAARAEATVRMYESVFREALEKVSAVGVVIPDAACTGM